MTPDQLLGELACDPAQVPFPPLFEQQREEDDLKEHVPELVPDRGIVPATGCFGEFIRLLDRMGNDRAFVLFPVPGAFSPETAGHFIQPLQRLRE